MHIEQLRAFLAVVETGSFLTAARSLRVSRATLRRRIDELEVRAGTRLLERTRAGAIVTESGAILAARGRLLIQEVSALLHSLREIGSEPTGVLRVMLPVGLPPHVLTPLFVLVRTRYPRLSFQLRLSDHPVSELLNDVDLAIHFGAQGLEGPFITHELMRLRTLLIASADYLARQGTPRSIDELQRHDLFIWEPPEAEGADARACPLVSGGSFPIAPRVVARDIHLLRQFAIAGLGIALVPDAMLPDPGLPQGALVHVLPDVVGGEIALRAAVPAVLAEIPKIKAVLEMLQPFLSKSGARST